MEGLNDNYECDEKPVNQKIVNSMVVLIQGILSIIVLWQYRQLFRPFGIILAVVFLMLIAVFVYYIFNPILHEAYHWIAYWIFGLEPDYSVKWPDTTDLASIILTPIIPYVVVSEQPISKIEQLIALLFPVLGFSLTMLVVATLFGYSFIGFGAALSIAFNVGGSAGDLYDTYHTIGLPRDSIIWMEETNDYAVTYFCKPVE